MTRFEPILDSGEAHHGRSPSEHYGAEVAPEDLTSHHRTLDLETKRAGTILCPVCWADIEAQGGEADSALVSACQTLGHHMTNDHGLTYEDVGQWLNGILRTRGTRHVEPDSPAASTG